MGSLPNALNEIYNENHSTLAKIRNYGAKAFENAMIDFDSEKQNEKHLTDNLLSTYLKEICWEAIVADEENDMQETQDSAGTNQSAEVKVTHQSYNTGINIEHSHKKGHVDILLYERSKQDEDIGCPISLIEVGLEKSSNWWEKVHQGYTHVSLMRNPTQNDGKADQKQRVKFQKFDKYPMFLSSIIISKNNNDSKKVGGEFGVFLCVPVSDDNEKSFRVILLWRQKVHDNTEKASQAFGKIIQASYALWKWRKKYYDGNIDLEYEYLGPNCAKIDNKLYRSYDTRLRPTDLSPYLYIQRNFHWCPRDKEENTPDDEITKVILDVSDDPAEGERLLDFGESFFFKAMRK